MKNIYLCGGSYTVQEINQTYPHWIDYVSKHLGFNTVMLGKVGCANDMIHAQVEYALSKLDSDDIIIVWLEGSGRLSYVIDNIDDNLSFVEQINYKENKLQQPPDIDFIPRIGSTIFLSLPTDLKETSLKYLSYNLNFYKDQQSLRSMLYLIGDRINQVFFIPCSFGLTPNSESPANYNIPNRQWLTINREHMLSVNGQTRGNETVNHLDSFGHRWLGNCIIHHLKSNPG
jgi:hypothetical protein